jgi:hypothetical protein
MTPAAIALVDVTDPRRLLPPEEGSLILVLGGTAVLVLSLTFALAARRTPLRRGSPTPSVGPRPKRTTGGLESADVGPAPESRLAVQELLLMASARSGVGTPQIVTGMPGPHSLVLVDGLACRPGGSRGGCDWKQDTLERSLGEFLPGTEVVQVSCHPEETRACIFEVRTGDVAP